MSDESGRTDYHGISQPGFTQPPIDPVDRVFGATSNVDGNDLVFDETNSLWVYANDHDALWLGAIPNVEAEKVDLNPTSEPASTETFVKVNVAPVSKLRLRETANVNGALLGSVVDGTVLRVVNSDNPEWTLVEALVDGVTTSCYVKASCVVLVVAQNE